jgi:Bifunctional DNA primase/polymerase, N-terminal
VTPDVVRARGWEVVRLHGKKPAGTHWEITKDPTVVSEWLEAGHNVGLVCGQPSGVAALDPDDPLAWADMTDTLGEPGVPWVETGSGKHHYYIAWERDLPAKLVWEGVIIGEIQRGPGLQQVVMPPSIHPETGRLYRWLVDPVTESLRTLPGAWRQYFHAPRPTAARELTPAARSDRYTAALSQPGARRRLGGAEVKFACPACRALGRDTAEDNARLLRDGGFGCAVYPKGTPGSLLHWRAIGIALGVLGLDGRIAR